MKKWIQPVLILLLRCTLYAETYDWEIIDRNGIVLHSIPKAEYVSRLSEGIIAIEYGKESMLLLNSWSFDEIHRARGGNCSSFAVILYKTESRYYPIFKKENMVF